MKHRFLFIIALLLTAASAWADDEPTTIVLTKNTDGTVWTLSTMPEYDVELEVTYKTDLTLTVSLSGWTYGGTANTPTVTGNEGSGTVTYNYKKKDADNETYSADVPTDAGTYTIRATVAETDDYADGVVTADFTIAAADIAATDITAPTANTLNFTGLAQELIVAGSVAGGIGTMQYSLDGTNWNTDIPTGTDEGDYTVYYKVVGDDNHNDVAAQSFKVTIGAALDIDLTSTDGKVWTLATTPYYDVELEVVYKTDLALTVSITGWTYGGTANAPSVSGNEGNGAVTYEYKQKSAADNTYSTDVPTDAGEYTVRATVAETDDYADGTAMANFTITQATATISYATTTVSKAFGNAAFTNTLTKTPATGTGLGTVTYAVTAETKDAECTSVHVATVNETTGQVTITGYGTATITATVTDGTNYTYSGMEGYNSSEHKASVSYTLTVAKGTITASATGGSYSYSASGSHAITVSVTKPSSGYTIKYGTTAGNYELSSNPSYSTIGSHTTYYKVSAPNYNDFTGQATVTINKASGSLSFASSSLTKTYGDDNFVNALYKTGDGAVTYSSSKPAVATVDASTGLVTIKGTGTTTISATMSATDAYSGDYATFSLTVNAASLTGAMVTLSQTSYDYDGTAKEPTVSAVILNGKVLTSSDYDVSYADNTNAGTATVTVTGKGNYTGTASQTFTINSVTTTDGNITVVDGGSETVLTINDMGNQQGKTVTPDLQVTTLNYYRSLNASDESVYTVCLPYAPKTDASLKYYTLTGCEGTTLQFDEITGTPQAYTPYLVSASKTTDIGKENMNQPITMSQTVVNSFSAGNYVMKGSLSGFTHDQSVGKYILQSSNRWGLVGSDTHAYIPPFRAYIEATVSGARMLDSSFYDEATGIYSLRTVDRDGTERYYDLNGRRIDDPKTTGIYIHNGRKEVLK